jgi:hypothetical protein
MAHLAQLWHAPEKQPSKTPLVALPKSSLAARLRLGDAHCYAVLEQR